MVDAADPRFDARMDRMEAVIREIQGAQMELRSEQTWLKWMAGIVVAVALTVAGIGLQRSFVLTDRLADVRGVVVRGHDDGDPRRAHRAQRSSDRAGLPVRRRWRSITAPAGRGAPASLGLGS